MANNPTPGALRPLIIVGGGGHARETIWLAQEATQPWQVIGCLDDAEAAPAQLLPGVPVLGKVADWTRFRDADFVVAIGSPRVRRTLVRRMHEAGEPRFATLVHRSVLHSSYVEIGAGTMVLAGSILSTQISVGQHVILNLSTTVAHDCVLEDFSTVAPQVALLGGVHLCAGAEIGTGACLRQSVRIGRGAMIGMGAVVTQDVADGALVVGSPARTLRQLEAF